MRSSSVTILLVQDLSYHVEALIAGADVFLRKPEDVGALPEMVACLLKREALKVTKPV
jgi:DNA-binding response OmpR family regulator